MIVWSHALEQDLGVCCMDRQLSWLAPCCGWAGNDVIAPKPSRLSFALVLFGLPATAVPV